MKNRVILNGQGVPIVPAPDKKSKDIAAKVAATDAKLVIEKVAMHGFTEGLETGMDCMKSCFTKAKEVGHQAISLDDAIALTEKVTEMCKKSLAGG